MSPAIWWIRRDIRLWDNQALLSAVAHSQTVIPLFIIDPFFQQSEYFSPRRWYFLLGCLLELDINLKKHGGRLILRQGNPFNVLRDLIYESSADTIFAEQDASPYSMRRDSKITRELPVRWVGFNAVHPPGSVVKKNGDPFSVFTPFMKAWKQLPFSYIERQIVPGNLGTPENIISLSFPSIEKSSWSDLFPPGEKEANQRLELFCNGADAPIYRYSKSRNFMNVDGTSRLSPYIRFGCISLRRAVSFAYSAKVNAPDLEAKENSEIWLNEIIWSDFYKHILYHYPFVRKQSFQSNLRNIKWNNDEGHFKDWCQGKTGYPIIDAGMRQLFMTGWMHNRSRMATASFLVKDLLIDWRWGERWFMQHLLDGDPAANNGGWQWTAGTGTDAAPYFRIFNPILQGKKYDPYGKYIKKWLPELADVPDRFIHEPWKMTPEQQKEFNCIIGCNYPAPIVNHNEMRQIALSLYKDSKNAG